MTAAQVIVELRDSASPVRHTSLIQLSGLSGTEVRDMMSSWNEIDANRRRELLDRMTELADDNIELDYSTLFRACLHDEDEGVRARAARSLWDSDDRTNIRPLVGLLTRDDSAEVRAAAATALGKFVEMTEEGKLIRREGQKIADALVGVIENPQEHLETRCRAIEAVAALTSEKVHSIIEQAYRDDDIRLKQSAIYAMGRRSDSSWLPTVLRETGHVEAAIRYEAVTASGHLGDEDTVPHLINSLNDEDSQVQLAAVNSLGLIGGDLAQRALAQAMQRGDDAIKEAAEQALEAMDFDDDPLGFRFE
jgi:HEAT repeat protein